MMNKLIARLFIFLSCFLALQIANAQEHEVPLKENIALKNYKRPSSLLRARTNLTLPFFEDFTDTSLYPLKEKWQDSMVYVNNTLGTNVISLGLATFDAMNAKGVPYSPSSPFTTVYSDSLTSQYFDLSSYAPSDSLYLSFLYEGKGNGYSPLVGDSLMLFMQNRIGAWVKVWSEKGSSMDFFNSAIIPMLDTSFFHPDFRFRFVNKATYNTGNSQWNVDYIKFDKNRNYQDTVYNDVAFTDWGIQNDFRSLLDQYTSMPYRHFDANRNRYLSGKLGVSLRNNWYAPKSSNVTLELRNSQSGAVNTSAPSTVFFQASDNQSALFTVAGSIIQSNNNNPLTVEMKAYFSPPIVGDFSKENDTISYRQDFDNYFAYDDGSAESALFMTSYQGVPSYVAQEYFLEIPDTLRGVSIYFPQQVPSASQKMFYLQVYKNIDASGTPDQMVYQQTDLYPVYDSTHQGLVTYAFPSPVIIDSGTFYVALMFPAGGFSDSLYIGLDKNKTGANFRYFKVGTNWETSLIDGALLIRPIVGRAIPLAIQEGKKGNLEITLFPNPVQSELRLEYPQGTRAQYELLNIEGKKMKSGKIAPSIDVTSLPEGTYYIHLWDEKGNFTTKKLIKLAK